MAQDVELQLADALVLADGTTATTPIDTVGGYRADVRGYFSALATTGDTIDVTVQASIDGGGNYFPIATIPQFGPDDDPVEWARPVYIPQPASGQLYTKVRLSIVISSGGSATLDWCFVEPLISIAPPDLDEVLSKGLALLT